MGLVLVLLVYVIIMRVLREIKIILEFAPKALFINCMKSAFKGMTKTQKLKIGSSRRGGLLPIVQVQG